MRCLRCLPGAMNTLQGVPYLSDAHVHALGRCDSAYLDDAAAPGGRSRSLQEAGLGVPGGPCGAWQCDPAATVPHPATRGRGCSIPGGSVGGGSGVVFASGSVERHRTLPASRALGHGQARFGSSRRDSTTDTGVQPPAGLRSGTGRKPRRTLSQRPTAAAAIAATLWRGDIAGAEASSGCGPGGQRAGAGGGEKMRAGGRSRRKAAGGAGDPMRTPARRRQKAPGAGPGAS